MWLGDAAGLRSPQSAQTSPLQLRSMKALCPHDVGEGTGKNLSAWVEPSLGCCGSGCGAPECRSNSTPPSPIFSAENGVVSGVYVRDSHEYGIRLTRLIRSPRRDPSLWCFDNEQMRIK